MLDFGTLDAAADDNGFDLLPGESRTLTISGAAPDAACAAPGPAHAGREPLMRLLLASSALCLALAAAAPPIRWTKRSPARSRVSLERKAAQLQSTAPADPALGLPAYDWWNEGLHGLARNGVATVFPQAIGLAATWDPALMERVGTVISTEARARFNAQPLGRPPHLPGPDHLVAQHQHLPRSALGPGPGNLWRRPLLTGSLAVGFIKGLQGPDLPTRA
jgi:beta-glucosidase